MSRRPAPAGPDPGPRHSEIARLRAQIPAPCRWTYDDLDDKWDTACGRAHQFWVEGPAENHFTHCPYCGGRLIHDPQPA